MGRELHRAGRPDTRRARCRTRGRGTCSMLLYLLLILGGVVVGTFGTLIGAGGGFILAPVLLLLYPHDTPQTITSISLAVTFANAFSGSVAYGRMKRINYKYGLMFSGAAVPGAVLGAIAVRYVPRREFDLVFAIVMIAAAVLVFVKAPAESDASELRPVSLSRARVAQGILISVAVGFLSSLLGIGGGIIHVPALAGILGFPVHVATATSHFILAFSAGAGTVAHVASGAFQHGIRRTIALAVGVLIGAQIGARMSTHVKGRLIIRALAVGLALVGVRLMFLFFTEA